MKLYLLLLFVVYVFQSSYAQYDEMPEVDASDVLTRSSLPCQTKERTRGYCIPVVKCKEAVSGIRKYQNPNLCFFRGDMPHVCCPIRLRHPPQSKPPKRPPPPSSGKKVEINPDGCGRRAFEAADGSEFVVGGREAHKYSWPWMAAIRVKTFGEYTGFLCGGSLITPRHVLTAAHCFNGQLDGFRNMSDYTIVLGSHLRANDYSINTDEEKGITTVKATYIKIHEEYDMDSNDNDIAVITLDTDVPTTNRVRPVCLPTRTRPYNTDFVTILGWGDTQYGGVGSKSLQEATFQVVNYSRCKRIFRPVPKVDITDNMLCAGGGKKDACQNDSGGPLLAKNTGQNKWVQVGVVSFGYQCAVEGFPGVYTRVVNYIPWIKRQVRR